MDTSNITSLQSNNEIVTELFKKSFQITYWKLIKTCQRTQVSSIISPLEAKAKRSDFKMEGDHHWNLDMNYKVVLALKWLIYAARTSQQTNGQPFEATNLYM